IIIPVIVDREELFLYSVTSLKSIPELSRRRDGAAEERPAPSINWNRSVSSHSSGGMKPTGLPEVHSKFRPVKRVSPLKHQPETTDSDPDGKGPGPGPANKDNGPGGKARGPGSSGGRSNAQAVFGELEHYDLDMDEILDVPYIKSSQQMSTLPRTSNDKRSYCVLSPVKWSDLRKSKSMDPDLHHLHCSTGGGASGSRGVGGSEVDEETKKNQNIMNIVREGQMSLLPHLAADNLELIRDDDGNNLLHIAASQGHADCLQHLTSLMGEDGLNERNSQQFTPAGLGVKNGHLECVRWMVSETEAIAELSCTREHPSLIHYAGRYGQEKVLLWLLQFMQEQAISLDEMDQNGNTAVHVAAQYGHLTCLQTLVEYGSNVTVQNQQGERPSQSAERQGHTTCARYLVVVETCMSLASQVVKLTKQLHEQATEKIALQKQMQRLMDSNKAEGTPSRSPSSHQPPGEAWQELMLTAEGTLGDGQWMVRQGGAPPDSVLHQLLGKDASETLSLRERAPPAAPGKEGPGAPGGRRPGLVERRELKLARLKQIMQRSVSESDTDPPEEGKVPGPLPPPSAERKHTFALSGSKSVDSFSFRDSETNVAEAPGDKQPATSPKSALKSPSSRRKTSQNLKLRVTFDEQVHKSSIHEAEPSKGQRTSTGGSEQSKRPFGTFRSIMESLSGNANHNNNNTDSPDRRSESKGSPGGGAKSKSKTTNV
uniref:Synphilin-1-like n=1 Tax=Gouania willdenowi TaxID=441366 RepID=A0A8C5EMX5_GOUWI